MILDTTGIHEGHSTLHLASALESVRDNMPPFTEPVVCEAELDCHEASIVVTIRFSGQFDQQCARCLDVYKHQVAGEIRLILQEADGRCGQAKEGEIADYFYNSEEYLVDVSPSIYDEIMTSLPLKPLCSETCMGIVLETKNGVAVAMPDENQVDPRWDALRKLQKKTQI